MHQNREAVTPQQRFGLDGKVALVTGAARGLGAETARALAQAGARVVISDIADAQGATVAAGIEGCVYHHHDVTCEADWQRVVAAVVAEFGGLDLLVNNAGVESTALFADCGLDEFKRVMSINVDGTFLGIKWAIRAMRPGGSAGRGGCIVNLSSVAGLVGVPGLGAYCSAKGAVRLMSKAAALECARLGYGIRVNSVHPGLVDSEMGSELIRGMAALGLAPDEAAARALFGALHPLGLGVPADVVGAVCYLASDAARWITGSELVLDGGLSAG